MKQEIIINGFSILGKLNYDQKVNEKTENKLNYVILDAEIVGQKEFNNYSNAIEHNELKIEIPSMDIKFNGKKNGYSSSYTDLEDKEQILYRVKINIDEIDKDETNTGLDIFGNMGINIMYNWARTRALSELLIAKGLFTFEEYDEKIKFIIDRDREEFIQSFNIPLAKNEKKDEE